MSDRLRGPSPSAHAVAHLLSPLTGLRFDPRNRQAPDGTYALGLRSWHQLGSAAPQARRPEKVCASLRVIVGFGLFVR